MDLYIIRNVSTKTFISLVSDFKKGNHIDPETNEVREGFKELVIYKRCIGVKIEGVKSVCADGEIFPDTEVDIRIVPKAINLYLE